MSAPESVRQEPTPNRDPEDLQHPSFRNLLCAWSVGFLGAIEGTISVPSLWPYIQSLGGTHYHYGLCLSAFPLGKITCNGLFGMWVDKRPFKEVYIVSLLISMGSGLLYSAGPFLGLWSVVAARGILGAMSANVIATQTYVSKHTRPADRTKYMSINVLVTNVLTVAGPAFNFIIVILPHASLRFGALRFVLNNFTWVGYFLCAGQLLFIICIAYFFVEPQPKSSAPTRPPSSCLMSVATLGGFFPWPRVFLDKWLHRTGAWILLVNNLRNVFTDFTVQYSVPLITQRDYGFGQLQTSYIFFALAIESILSTMVLARLSKRCSDRMLIIIWSCIAWSGLGVYVFASSFGAYKISLLLFIICLVWYDFGTALPPTQSLYSKVIGKQNVGLYFSVLVSNSAISRTLSGWLVAIAYGQLGAPCVWGLVHCLYGVSMVLFGSMWRRFSPDYIDEMHARLTAERLDQTISMQRVGTE